MEEHFNEQSADELELVAAFLAGPVASRRQRAGELLARVGLSELSRLGVSALSELGVHPQEARRLCSAFELARRAARQTRMPPRILCPKDAYQCVAPFLCDLEHERFVVAVLDVKNRLRRISTVSQGGVESCPVDPRAVFLPAVRECGTAVLLAHNHPSGDPTPSKEDLVLTERLARAARILGLTVLDHIVVGRAPSFVSLAERGYLAGLRDAA